MEQLEPGLVDKIAHCRKCKAEIMWVLTSKNKKWTPVDYKPVRLHPGDEGKFVLENGDVVSAKNLQEDCWGYVSHWASCPNAQDFRRKK